MTELTFARTFLTALSSLPIKTPSDHVEDLRNFPAPSAYTLPKPLNAPPPPKRAQPSSSSNSANDPTTTPLITVHLSPLRTASASEPSYLPMQHNLPLTTSILDIKRLVADKCNVSIDKIKLLYLKRPVGDTKMIQEVFKGDAKQGMELGVMVVGGEKKEGVAQARGVSGGDVLAMEEFWDDLKGFLVQRLRDEGEGERVWRVFRRSLERNGRRWAG